jgi:hypothetical protein
MMWSSHHCCPRKWRITVIANVNVSLCWLALSSCENERAVAIKSANEMRSAAIMACGLVLLIRGAVAHPCRLKQMVYPFAKESGDCLLPRTAAGRISTKNFLTWITNAIPH